MRRFPVVLSLLVTSLGCGGPAATGAGRTGGEAIAFPFADDRTLLSLDAAEQETMRRWLAENAPRNEARCADGSTAAAGFAEDSLDGVVPELPTGIASCDAFTARSFGECMAAASASPCEHGPFSDDVECVPLRTCMADAIAAAQAGGAPTE